MWFAFKFVFLYWLIQRNLRRTSLFCCCDLLSNLYFCIGWYSLEQRDKVTFGVVICFQICIFVLVDTAAGLKEKAWAKLWFAFKFVFLYWLIQRLALCCLMAYSCDLLSNLYFCIGWYSPQMFIYIKIVVVICFQICIFVLVDTADLR